MNLKCIPYCRIIFAFWRFLTNFEAFFLLNIDMISAYHTVTSVTFRPFSMILDSPLRSLRVTAELIEAFLPSLPILFLAATPWTMTSRTMTATKALTGLCQPNGL